MNDRELIEKLEAAAERHARRGGPDRPYYDEWRMRLLRIDPNLYEVDADAQNRRAGRYLSPQKRKRLDTLAAKLDAGNLSEQEAKAIVKRAWGILTPVPPHPEQQAEVAETRTGQIWAVQANPAEPGDRTSADPAHQSRAAKGTEGQDRQGQDSADPRQVLPR
jgi:hypothetical protein